MPSAQGSGAAELRDMTWDLAGSENSENDAEKYLTFFIDQTLYAISSFQVLEILPYEKITKIPRLPDFIKGVVNIRGKIIPVLDLAMVMGKEPARYTEETCLILVEDGNTVLGLLVDRVNDVSSVEKAGITEYSKLIGDKGGDFVSGICKTATQTAMILDIHKVLAVETPARSR